jgi:hypothetical protein
VTAEATVAGEVTNAVVRALVDKARARPERGRVIGVRATPDPGARRDLSHEGETVHVVPCVSALAIRTALLDHQDDEWLVILTDRPEEDLGAGILGHFWGYRLMTPDPWDAIKQRFGATRLDRELATRYRRAAIAVGLLRISPVGAWPAAPAGVLSAAHAFGAVARERLGFTAATVDLQSVLSWSVGAGTAARIAGLRVDAGNELADAVLEWLAARCGDAEAPVRQLLFTGAAADLLPVGVAVGVLTDVTANRSPEARGKAQLGLARLDHRWAGAQPVVTPDGLAALGLAAATVVKGCVSDPRTWALGRHALVAADQVLAGLQSEALGQDSGLLPSGLDRRYALLGGALRRVPEAGSLADVEAAWALVTGHALFEAPRTEDRDDRVVPFRATVRLARWLATPEEALSGLAAMARRQAAVDAWVDAAFNDAAVGVFDAYLGEVIEHVLKLVEQRRRSHDREFAAALAASTSRDEGVTTGYLDGDGDRVWLLEHVLRGVVRPLAARPTLLLVLDGMSTASATELLHHVLDDVSGWAEVIPKGSARRGAALAVLPTLTEFSRTSLLSGRLVGGGQDAERAGFEAAMSGVSSVLHHKKIIDTTRLGFQLAGDVYHDITAVGPDGSAEKQVVACVLNTIDDALDRSDPAGTTWNQESVKHLRAVLNAARAAERTVVLTADHGHIVERRRGTQRPFAEISSARSRPVSTPAGEDEVLVSGTRVLAPGGKAVLAVDETLRYGPLKAGYHGGASPAEAVVPLAVLIPAGVEAPGGWDLAPRQEPVWWTAATSAPVPEAVTVAATVSSKNQAPSLFDELEQEKPATGGLGAAVISSKTYADQVKVAGRVSIEGATVALLIDALATAPATRLPVATAGVVLQVPPTRMAGALAQLRKLLNVEGYGILRADGAELVLDAQLLREQFGVRA